MIYDERDMYTGLAALHWSTISQTDPRVGQAFYQRIIERNGGQALELGYGAGRLLLAYLQHGLDVQGADLSGEMLAVCRAAAHAAGLAPVLYEQPMQLLDLPHTFRTIYIPCGSFVCVIDRMAALQTLQRCYAHLEPGGQLAFNVFLPDYDYSGNSTPDPFPRPWQPKAVKQLPQGRRLVISFRETGVDPVEQIWMEERRYELYDGERLLKQAGLLLGARGAQSAARAQHQAESGGRSVPQRNSDALNITQGAASMQTISTFLMFDGSAEAAMSLYISLFPNSAVASITRYGENEEGAAGSVRHAQFTLNGQPFMCIDSYVKHAFGFTPAISLYVSCESEAELDALYAGLSQEGEILMPLDAYPFSPKFAWLNDRWGVSWQLALAAS